MAIYKYPQYLEQNNLRTTTSTTLHRPSAGDSSSRRNEAKGRRARLRARILPSADHLAVRPAFSEGQEIVIPLPVGMRP